MTKTKRNLVLILMCALLVAIAMCPVSATQGTSGVVKTSNTQADSDYSYMQLSAEYSEVASTENISMSADFNTGSFAVKNLNNGYVWYSTPNSTEYDGFSKGEIERFSKSDIIVSFVNAEEEVKTARVNYLDYEELLLTEVSSIDNGIRVLYTFEVDLSSDNENSESSSDADGQSSEGDNSESKIVQVKVPVEYFLENDHFSAKVDITAVECPDDLIITEYNVLPYFGAGSWVDDGYIFVPDGSGALISFKGHENSSSTYEEMVYGDDLSVFNSEITELATETVRMPVFGMINGNDNAFIGIIDEGASSSSILASPTSADKGYSTVSAKLNYKLTSSLLMFGKSYYDKKYVYRLTDASDDVTSFKVDYYLLNGNDADYVGMANVYRDYLLENDLLAQNNIEKPSLNVDIYGAIDVKANILGFTYRKLQALTTYEQATSIADKLTEAGINNLSLRYKGWANNGITNNKVIKNAKIIDLLGGSKGYTKLQNYVNNKGIQLYTDTELTTFTDDKIKYAARTGFSEVYYEYQYLRSVYAYDLNGYAKMKLNPSYLLNNAKGYFEACNKLGNKNVSISDITDTVYSHLKKDESFYRTKYVTEVKKVLELAGSNNLNVAGDTANDYAFKYLNKIYKAPIYNSGYDIFDSEIPFYEIVLHGYIPMTGEPMVQSTDSQVTYLKCVESGMELLWSGIHEESEILSDTIYDDLYGSNYALWIDDAAVKYAEYQPLLEKVYNQAIVDHKEIQENITLTEYANGIKVYVNYTNSSVNIDGIKVPAKSFKYKEV